MKKSFHNSLCTILLLVATFCFSAQALCAPLQKLATPPQTLEPYHFSLKSIPKHAWGDIRQTFWSKNGVVLILGSASALALLPMDESLSDKRIADPLFSKNLNRGLDTAFSTYALGGASAVTFLIGTQTHNNKFKLMSESLAEAWVFTEAMVTLGKVTVQRTRPNGDNYSMPSNHSAASFSIATVLTEYYGLKAAIPAYTVASVVAFSRVDGGYHYLTDVLVGAVLGTTIGMGVSEFHKHEFSDFLILPQITPDGVVLGVSKSF